jgi:molecular chaperone IbpA
MQMEPMKKKTWDRYPDYKQYEHKTELKPVNPFDLINPILNSMTIGLERQFGLIEGLRNTPKQTYPPYNIVRVDDDENYIIEIAAAGFSKEEIEITSTENQLLVKGSKEGDDADYLHKGIAARTFEKSFVLGDDVKVVEASMIDGILSIRLEREIPEHKKPRIVEIK